MKTAYTVRAHNGNYEFNHSHNFTPEAAATALIDARQTYPNSAYLVEHEVADNWGINGGSDVDRYCAAEDCPSRVVSGFDFCKQHMPEDQLCRCSFAGCAHLESRPSDLMCGQVGTLKMSQGFTDDPGDFYVCEECYPRVRNAGYTNFERP